MYSGSTARVRIVLLSIAAALAMASTNAAEVEKKPELSQAEIDKKLEDARRRLDTAAREVAELSMSKAEFSMPHIKHFSRRAMLGINLGARAEDQSEGVSIVSVSPGGGAERAGLKAGDVLLAIGEKQLKRDGDMSPRDVLLKEMESVKPGDKVQLRYRRDGKVANVTVTAEEPLELRPAAPAMLMPDRGVFSMNPFVPMRPDGVFGSAELVSLTPKLGRYFGTDKGLLVVRAPDDSRLKLEEGDVIMDIDGRTPSSPSHAFRILGSYQAGEKLKLGVLRQKKKMSFDITIPDEPTATPARPLMFHRQLDGSGSGQGDILIGPGPGHALPPPPPVPGRRLEVVSIDEPA